MMSAIRTAILGASGYTGAELVRLLSVVPEYRIVALSADRKAGQAMGDVFPHLSHVDLPMLSRIEEIDFGGVDHVFCALPHATTQGVIRDLPEQLKIVDLSADFRLRDPADYKRWYGGEHSAVALQKTAVYGLPEFYREEIARARLVASTGCYVATGVTPLIPLVSEGVIDPDEIVVDAKSGVSGAGRAAKEGTLFAEVSEGFHAYGVASHRHTAEYDQELSLAAGRAVEVTFTPHLIPQNRGILATIYVRGEAEAVHSCLAARFGAEPFVDVLPLGTLPHTRHVRGSNYQRIGVIADRRAGRTIIVSALDNLVKGASGQAIQNANIMHGLPETTALLQQPLFP
jgi:N-acetyl-gamma-glutamyl-phosphate reductase